MMSSAKKNCSSDSDELVTATKWEGPEPDWKQEFPYQKTGHISPDTVKEFTDYTKIHHRADEPLENWNRFDKFTTFDETQKADLVRLALVDVIHQRQFQTRAIGAGITNQGWNSIHPDYYQEYYSWMFPTTTTSTTTTTTTPDQPQQPPQPHQPPNPTPIQTANIMAPYPPTPIMVTDYGESFSSKTMTRTRVENPTDIDLGFPALLPFGPEVDTQSWMASIDRIPAQLFSRKICRRVYETLNKAVIITNLPQLYEQKATELAQNRRDIAEGKEPTYKDIACEGSEVALRALQDKPRTADQIQDQKQRRENFTVSAQPHECHYPLYFWTIPYLADLSQSEVHDLKRDGVLPRQKTIPADPENPEGETKQIGAYSDPPHPYGECFFRIGETDNGHSIRVRAKLYYQYMLTNRDDSPLYLFESNLYKSRLASTIPTLFHPPTWLVADLVRDVLPIPRRPPFQWFLQGMFINSDNIQSHRDGRVIQRTFCSLYSIIDVG